MHWLYELSYFFGGLLLTNSIPHFVSGVQGRPFQTPFANPPGKGLSSSMVNVVWGFFNLVLSYLLICRVGNFDLHSTIDAAALGAAVLLGGIAHARSFARFHGGDLPASIAKASEATIDTNEHE